MTPDEARSKFSAAIEGDLSPEEQKVFDQLLAADAVLRSEYDAFRDVLALTKNAVLDRETPELLRGVQSRIRARSRGRFYRDRFSERADGRTQRLTWVTVAAIAVVLGLVWALFHVTTM